MHSIRFVFGPLNFISLVIDSQGEKWHHLQAGGGIVSTTVVVALALAPAVEEEGAAGTNGIEVRARVDFGPRMKLLGLTRPQCHPATIPTLGPYFCKYTC